MLAPTVRPRSWIHASMSWGTGKLLAFHVKDPQGPYVCQFMSKIHASSGIDRLSKSSMRRATASLSKLNHLVNIVPRAQRGGKAGGPDTWKKSSSAPAKSRPCMNTYTSTEFLEGANQPSVNVGMPVSLTIAHPRREIRPKAQCCSELFVAAETLWWQFRSRVCTPPSSVRAVPSKFPSAGSSPQDQRKRSASESPVLISTEPSLGGLLES
mmetsp:Transcript_1664/g.4941  ORF Transcript_1664/g.4941 Transcript_1664/m.4941 type:complete len:211 (+) Transcript_1664:947-1579(+)